MLFRKKTFYLVTIVSIFLVIIIFALNSINENFLDKCQPTCLVDRIGNYNIISHQGYYIAAQKSLGNINFNSDYFGDRDLSPFIFTGRAKDILKEKIKEGGYKFSDYFVTKIAESSIACENIDEIKALVGKKYFEGNIIPYIFSSRDKKATYSFIDKVLADKRNSLPVNLLRSKNSYNVVQVGKTFVAINKSLGNVDFNKDYFGDRDLKPYIYVAQSQDHLLKKIDNDTQNKDNYSILNFKGLYVAMNKKTPKQDLLGKKYYELSFLPYICCSYEKSEIDDYVESQGR